MHRYIKAILKKKKNRRNLPYQISKHTMKIIIKKLAHNRQTGQWPKRESMNAYDKGKVSNYLGKNGV